MSEAKNTDLGNVTIEIAGLDVTLPIKFAPGHVLTDNEAKVLDAAYQRQFTNNQNASAKARAEAFAKATTDADKAAKAPLTAAQIAELYANYQPSVGGTRIGSMEKIRQDAAWRMWTAKLKAHNDNVTAHGGPVLAQQDADYVPVIAKAGTNIVPTALKPRRDADGKVVATVQEQRDNLITRLLAQPEYADEIQQHVDAILAEKGSAKETTAAAENTVSIDDLI